MEVIPLSDARADAAVGVLVAAHARGRDDFPRSVLADPAVAAAAVGDAIRTGLGVLVVDGPPVAFMIAPLPNVPGPTTVRLRPGHHACTHDDPRSVYRRMYEVVAAQLVDLGCTEHSLPVAADATAALQALFEMEFGLDQIKGVRPLPTVNDSSPLGSGVRAASRDDVDRVVDLAVELQQFHARSPMFEPALLPVPAIRSAVIAAIDDDRSAVLVVDQDGDIVAMMQADPDGSYIDAISIGMNVVTESARGKGVGSAMLDHLLSWAASCGYTYCTVGWNAANPVSDPFYRARGFEPMRYRVQRRIDKRVSWANHRLDYSKFPLR